MGKLHMEVQSYLRQRPDGTFSFPIKYLNATHLADSGYTFAPIQHYTDNTRMPICCRNQCAFTDTNLVQEGQTYFQSY